MTTGLDRPTHRARWLPLGLAALLLLTPLAIPALAQDAGSPVPRADLRVADIRLVAGGLGQELHVTITNEGEAAAEDFVLRILAEDGTLLADHTIGWLWYGSTITYLYPDLPGLYGTFNVTATIDADDTVAETDETDNTLTVALNAGYPDLTTQILDLSTWPATWDSGTPTLWHVNAQLAVRNDGTAPVESVQWRIQTSDGVTIDGTLSFGLPGQQWTSVFAEWTTTTGEHLATAIVDPEDHVQETSETNNGFERRIYAGVPEPLPDLTITEITLTPAPTCPTPTPTATLTAGPAPTPTSEPTSGPTSPSDPSPGPTTAPTTEPSPAPWPGCTGTQATMRIENIGSMASSETIIATYLDGTYQTLLSGGWLDAGHVTWLSVPWPSDGARHELRAVIDPDNTLHELEEGNNVATFAHGEDTIDLTITSIWDPASVAPSGRSSVRFTVANHGNAVAGPSIAVVEMDRTQVAAATIPWIGHGYEQVFEIAFQAAPGPHTITVRLDGNNALAETDETNNEWSIPVDFGMPDLGIALESPALVSARYGDASTIAVLIRNDGAFPAPASVAEVRDNGELLAVLNVPALAAGTQYMAPVGWTLAPGVHEFTASADPANAVREANESNDVTVVVDLGVPALVATHLAHDQDVPEEGITMQVTSAFTYAGRLTLSSADARLYDGDTILATWTLHDLAAGDSFELGHTWNAAEGDHTLRFAVDAAPRLAGEDRSDNTLALDLYVRAPTPETCKAAGVTDGIQETCRRVLLGEDEPVGPLLP